MNIDKKTVFILEDDLDISEIIEWVLSEAGYEVRLFNTVNALNETITADLPDLFLLDILLPDGNGLDVCKRLKANIQTSIIPVLMMSAHSSKREVNAFGCKADFLSKPFDLDDLRKRVRQFIQ